MLSFSKLVNSNRYRQVNRENNKYFKTWNTLKILPLILLLKDSHTLNTY
jgi:hypothetical protein